MLVLRPAFNEMENDPDHAHQPSGSAELNKIGNCVLMVWHYVYAFHGSPP